MADIPTISSIYNIEVFMYLGDRSTQKRGLGDEYLRLRVLKIFAEILELRNESGSCRGRC